MQNAASVCQFKSTGNATIVVFEGIWSDYWPLWRDYLSDAEHRDSVNAQTDRKIGPIHPKLLMQSPLAMSIRRPKF